MVKDLTPFRWVQATWPEQVAKAMVRGVHRGQHEILVGWQSRIALLCARISPSLLNHIIRWSQPQFSTAVASRLN